MRRHFLAVTLLLLLPAIPALAQLPSNATLNGNYNIRYFGVNAGGSNGDIALSFSGTFAFNGNGGFTVTGSAVSQTGTVHFLTSGNYSVFSNGMMQMTNPFDPQNQTVLYGGVGANGVIQASSTEWVYVDMLIGIPQASGASNATLSGTYNVASMALAGPAGSNFGATSDTFFQVTANGSGSLGNVSVQGTAVNLNGAPQTQTSAGATYSVTANGTGTLTLPAPTGVPTANVLLSGAKVLAVSQDGNLFIAGSASGYDLIIGLKALPSGQKGVLSGYYYTGYFQNYSPTVASSNAIYATWGAANQIPALSNLELIHQRTNCDACYAAYDSIYSDNFAFASNGVVSFTADPGTAAIYAVGPNADMVIGAGLQNTNYELVFYVRAPTMTAPTNTSVFLNPQGVVNGGSFAPYSAQYSPGEVVTLFGTNLAASTPPTAAAPFPTNLGQVQVMVTGTGGSPIAAPVYFASPGQVSAVIPYNITSSNGIISFQVINNGTASNTVSGYLGSSSPGIFTIPPGGIYDGAITHADGSIVNSSSPAAAGSTVAIYLTGLGAVTPTTAAGAPGPTTPLAQVVNPVFVTFWDSAGNAIAGTVQTPTPVLAPTLGGLYQVNVVIPSGLASGECTIEITTTIVVDTAGTLAADADSFEAVIKIK